MDRFKRPLEPDERPLERCWGGELAGLATCPPVRPMNGAFKEHFCPRCREGTLFIPARRVWVLRDEGIANTHSVGVWNLPRSGTSRRKSTQPSVLPAHRIVNQTKCCSGAKLVILRDATHVDLPGLSPLPAGLQDSSLGFRVGKTLKPVLSVPLPHVRRRCPGLQPAGKSGVAE